MLEIKLFIASIIVWSINFGFAALRLTIESWPFLVILLVPAGVVLVFHIESSRKINWKIYAGWFIGGTTGALMLGNYT